MAEVDVRVHVFGLDFEQFPFDFASLKDSRSAELVEAVILLKRGVLLVRLAFVAGLLFAPVTF